MGVGEGLGEVGGVRYEGQMKTSFPVFPTGEGLLLKIPNNSHNLLENVCK